MMGKYHEYDAQLVSLIRGGCNTFDLLSRRTKNEAVKLEPDPYKDYGRVTDRRLQALRKSGLIAYCRSRQIWYINGTQE